MCEAIDKSQSEEGREQDCWTWALRSGGLYRDCSLWVAPRMGIQRLVSLCQDHVWLFGLTLYGPETTCGTGQFVFRMHLRSTGIHLVLKAISTPKLFHFPERWNFQLSCVGLNENTSICCLSIWFSVLTCPPSAAPPAPLNHTVSKVSKPISTPIPPQLLLAFSLWSFEDGLSGS